mmetsp:Transcript_140271/g.269046  ORF Transcript_140271/g.269046 Transcript_140271/m.269046 type:complete len:681 (-) Transcript_140271:135-2177(-)
MFDIDNAVDFDETANLSIWQKDVDTLLRKNKCGDALDVAENQMALCKNEKDAVGVVAAQNAVARCHFSARKYDKAMYAAKEALMGAKKATATKEEAAILHTLAKVQMYSKELSAAEDSAASALDLYTEGSNKTGEAAVLVTTASLRLLQGNITEALESAEKAMEIFEEVGETAGKVSVLHMQMAVYGILSRYLEAFDLSMQSVALLRQTEDKFRLASVLLMSADMAVPAGEIDEGMKCAKEALSLFEKFDDSAGKATALCTIARGYLSDKRWSNALHNADEAVKVANASCGKKDQATASFLATTVRRQKAGHGTDMWPPKRGIPEEDVAELHEYAKKSVSLYESLDDELGEASARFELAYSWLALGNTSNALSELNQALEKFQSAGLRSGEGNTIYTIAQVKFSKGDKGGAVSDMNTAIAILKDLKLDTCVKVANKVLETLQRPPEIYGESAVKKLMKGEKLGTANVGTGEQGGISQGLYSQFIHRSFLSARSHGEHIFENPIQVPNLQAFIGIKFPFWRGQEGKEHPNITPSAAEKASGKKKAAPKEGETGEIDAARGASFLRALDFQAQVKKVQSELEKEIEKPPPGGSVVGDDLLGGRAFDCPEELHEEMLGLAASNDIENTTPAQRKENMEKRPTFYGTPALRDAVRWGYIHPSMKAPYGLKWKQVRAGAFKLVPQ